jgi:hypothetical protein
MREFNMSKYYYREVKKDNRKYFSLNFLFANREIKEKIKDNQISSIRYKDKKYEPITFYKKISTII